ncbi:MAG: hypothetical protein AAFY16_07955 [Cyanobacteria bacterium J06642_3]
MRELIIKKNVTSQIADSISDIEIFADADIKLISVVPQLDYLQIAIEVTAPVDSIDQQQIDRVRNSLSRQIGRPIDLRVEIIPIKIFKSPKS